MMEDEAANMEKRRRGGKEMDFENNQMSRLQGRKNKANHYAFSNSLVLDPSMLCTVYVGDWAGVPS